LVYTIEVSTSDLQSDRDKRIDASVSTSEHYSACATVTAQGFCRVLTRLPEATITVDTVAGDGTINQEESTHAKTTITGTVGGDRSEERRVGKTSRAREYPSDVKKKKSSPVKSNWMKTGDILSTGNSTSEY